MEIQGLGHHFDLHNSGMRQRMDQGLRLRDLAQRLELRLSNDHHLTEVPLTGGEIKELQARIRGLKRDLADTNSLNNISGESVVLEIPREL
ncbi:hypothetical protein PI125_g830 [Phytophthora idaei]|nr:hypothetical protein PI125_g830 [Phytophthora idaei]KAG3172632.1 hypothetical protein PI126_g1269 [Phytophthora idaei]